MLKFIKWIIKTILVITGIIPLTRCSSGYKQENGKTTFNGKEITDKSFVVLSDEFAKDSTAAYYKERSFSYADVATFQPIDQHYAKDKNKVYYCDEYREGQNYYLTKKQTIMEVKNAVPASFKSLGNGYAKDDQHAFFVGVLFRVKDITTLKSIDNNFVKDDFQAYLNRSPIAGSDGKTFGIIDPYYAKDTNHIYFYNVSQEKGQDIYKISCDKSSFVKLEYPFSRDKESAFYEAKKINNVHVSTFNIIGHGYSKDKDAAYFKAKKISGAHAATFEVFKENDSTLDVISYAKDNNAVYLDDKKINEADVATFKILTLGYGSDYKHVFYKTNMVKDADPVTFKTYPHGYGDTDAEDAKNKYLAGKKLTAGD